MMKKLVPLTFAAAMLSGCTNTTLTNLTPRQQVRNGNNLYPVEVIWDSKQVSVRDQSITPYVLVDMEKFPMQRTLGLSNRWEAVIPVPKEKDAITYRYKFDYEYNSFGPPKAQSRLTPSYQLRILDK